MHMHPWFVISCQYTVTLVVLASHQQRTQVTLTVTVFKPYLHVQVLSTTYIQPRNDTDDLPNQVMQLIIFRSMNLSDNCVSLTVGRGLQRRVRKDHKILHLHFTRYTKYINPNNRNICYAKLKFLKRTKCSRLYFLANCVSTTYIAFQIRLIVLIKCVEIWTWSWLEQYVSIPYTQRSNF